MPVLKGEGMTSTSTVTRAALAAAAWVLALTGSLFLAAPASASTRPVMYGTYGAASGSWQGATIKPPAVYFGTDSVLSVRSLTWAYWNTTSAWGRGTRWQDNCIPNCATGIYHSHPATLTMWRVRWHHGQRYYTRMTMRWTTSAGTVHHQTVYSYSTAGGTVLFWH